jgi:asparagine synthase (glutamine-hydrolysing)
MCGIAGVVARGDGPVPNLNELRAMCDTLVHRGPDDEGLEIAGGVALGMRRLSIIDLSGGHQPIANEDGTVRVVFNGEIYNHRELRSELEGKGHRFKTASDTEVLVHLWEEEGTDFARRLNGMFAIALHDSRSRKCVLVRDHFGIKPLFFAVTPRHVVFGSEVKALLASGLVGRTLDLDALGEFLAWEYVPGPGTLLREIRKLPPSGLIEIDLERGDVKERSWYHLPASDRESRASGTPKSDGEWEEAVDVALRTAVRRQLVSDVPLGAFLSGGVDSSLVVAAMGDARTFSIGFDDPSYNELAWSERVAAHLGVRHRVEVIRPDVVDLFERLMHFMDDPIGDFSIFPTFLVSRLAREEVKVALSGDGGDEVFGGYETYVAQDTAKMWARIPGWVRRGLVQAVVSRLAPRPEKKGLVNKAKRFVEGVEHDPGLGHARFRLFVGNALRRELFTETAFAELRAPVERHVFELAREAGSRNDLDRGLYVDLRSYLSDNCLVKTDRMSMACSLEARAPLLDPDLVELAFRIPSRLKVHRGETKILLKRVAARHVPKDCVYRAKQGFSIPIKHWLGTAFRPLMEDLLSPARLEAGGLFRPQTVARLKSEHLEGRANHSHLLWSLLVFEDWRKRWGA